jgi:hypothetical protein
MVRFRGQSLAAHMAAGHLIDTCGRDESAWHRLDSGLAASPSRAGGWFAAEAGTGLAEALWDACLCRSDPLAPLPIPEGVHETIERQLVTQSDPREGPSPRVRRLVRAVLAPENPERARAIQALAALGQDAGPALPMLLGALERESEDLEVRHAALALIGLLGRDAGRNAVPGLQCILRERREHLFLRLKALEALLAAAPVDSETWGMLAGMARDPAESGVLRVKIAEAMARFGPVEAGEVPGLEPGSAPRAGV